MARLTRDLLAGGAILVLILVGCGPTAQVITTPTPVGSAGPGATVVPSKGEHTSSPIGPGTPGPGTPGPGTPAPPGTIAPGQTPGETSDLGSPPPSGALWQPLTDFPAGSALEVRAVAATADGFVAVGYEPMPTETSYGRRQGIVWRSADGITWQQTVEPAFQLVTPEDVTVFGDSLYVLGRLSACPDITDDTCVEVPEAGYSVWRSTSGGPWERLAQQPSMQAGLVDGLLAGHDHLAAFGSSGPNDETTTAWFSADGATWTETTDIPEMAPIGAMAEGPAGFVAFGTQFVPDLGDVQLRVALSTDYSHFALAPAPSLQGMSIVDVTLGSNGMAAVGYGDVGETGEAAIALWSADGSSWTQAADTDGSFGIGALTRVHALPSGGFVGLGFTPEAGDSGRLTGQSWFSADGQSWRSLDPIGGSFDLLESSALGASGLVVFAVAQDNLDGENIVSTISAWFAPADKLAGL